MIDDIGARSIPAGKRFARAIPSAIRDGIGLSAVGLISYGAWLIHPSAGFITAGTLLLAGVILVSTKKPKAD